MKLTINDIRSRFIKHFDGSTGAVYASPGRINLIGEVPLNVFCFVLCGLCTSVMWGGIFNLAAEGLGKYTALASGFFMVMVCGGGILPLIQGAVADVAGYIASYWVLFAAVGYLLFYALVGSKVNKRDE